VLLFEESILPFRFLDIYFCPFLKIPKYFPQKNMKKHEKKNKLKKGLKEPMPPYIL
jgi:hypothetical protein